MEESYTKTISLKEVAKESERNMFDAVIEYGDSLKEREQQGQENPARIIQFNDCYLIVSMFDDDMTVKFIKGDIEIIDKTIGV